MTDEEKKEVEYLKLCLNTHSVPIDLIWHYEAILNLIEKQQKEIEELKVIKSMQDYRIQIIDERELISKDKIRKKIHELELTDVLEDQIAIPYIKELLEEVKDE